MAATGSPRSFICFIASSADSPDSARMIRYFSPYRRRRSRATARDTPGSSSTVRIAGLPLATGGFTHALSSVRTARYSKDSEYCPGARLCRPGSVLVLHLFGLCRGSAAAPRPHGASGGTGQRQNDDGGPGDRTGDVAGEQALEQQPDAEREEQHGRADADDALGQMLAQDGADDDGQGVGRHHADGRADPHADRVVVGGEGDGGEHRLVAEFGEEERGRDGQERGAGGTAGLELLVFAEVVAAQGPGAEDEEGGAADDADRRGRERDAEVVADGHGHQVDHGGGDGDAGD